nr:hypothetical protein [Tanacetum cinerariifolium]
MSIVGLAGDLGINDYVLVPLVKIDYPSITIEEYIRLEEEKDCRHGKVCDCETTYGKIWYDEDVHDLRSVETEFPTLVFNDALTSKVALSCEPTVSPLNDNQINFRISFGESNDEDYTSICLRFCHWNLRTVDYYKDIEKEFPAIAYNDALTSKLDFLPEPTSDKDNDDDDNDKIDIEQSSGDLSIKPSPNIIKINA